MPYTEIPAEERALAEDLIYNRRAGRAGAAASALRRAAAEAERDEREDPFAGLTVDERIH